MEEQYDSMWLCAATLAPFFDVLPWSMISCLNHPFVFLPPRYVWMTGFGHGLYCWRTNDFSLARIAKSLWRMNFFVVLLSTATGTDWIMYYVVALHTTFFLLVYFSLWLGVLLARKASIA